jgi:hypothetical protein
MTNETGGSPATRDLSKLVNALVLVEAELGFQVHRLNEHVKPRTKSEIEYHENLKEGYGGARYWVGILKRYHEGRLERSRSGDSLPTDPRTAGPFIDEEDA